MVEIDFVPKKVFLTRGVGKAKEQLASFEMALRNAGIQHFNLVSVSSILPPGCKVISREKGLSYFKPGQIVFCVMARNASNEPNRLLSSGIGIAVPSDPNQYGYMSELHEFGVQQKRTADRVEDLAATMLASTLGIKFDPEIAWDERKQIYKMSHNIVRTSSIVQTAEVDKNGLWTTVVAAAVLVLGGSNGQ